MSATTISIGIGLMLTMALIILGMSAEDIPSNVVRPAEKSISDILGEYTQQYILYICYANIENRTQFRYRPACKSPKIENA